MEMEESEEERKGRREEDKRIKKNEPRILILATRNIHHTEGFIEYSLNTWVDSLSSLEKTEKFPVGR